MTRMAPAEELAVIAARQAELSEIIRAALVEQITLSLRSDVLLDRLNEQRAAEQPGRIV